MRRLLISRLRRQQNSSCRLIQRTAVYGPVRTVVWEGRSCEAPPYPDPSSVRLGSAGLLFFSMTGTSWPLARFAGDG